MSTNMAAIMTSAENLKFFTFIRDRPEQLNCDTKAGIK